MSHAVAEERPVEHGDALNQIRSAIAEAPGPEAAAQRAVDLLHDRFAHYDWVGIYWVDASVTELVLGPWTGPEATEHVRIPIGVGICGAAAASGQTEIVDDVDADERYLACFTTTRSEIVVPIFADGAWSARSTSTGPTWPPTTRPMQTSLRRSQRSSRRFARARNSRRAGVTGAVPEMNGRS